MNLAILITNPNHHLELTLELASKVKERHRIKEDNLDDMLAYISNGKLCRSRQLLQYFGEKAEDDCGICDICTNSDESDEITLASISKNLLLHLKEEALTSRKLIEKVSYKERDVLLAIQRLLEDEVIRINTKNQYELELSLCKQLPGKYFTRQMFIVLKKD